MSSSGAYAAEQSHNAVSETSSKGPLAQFGRFVDGRLKLIRAHTTELQYVAISHVWGKIEWIPEISNVDGEVLASRAKAKFIENKLPAVVGDKAFWMDTLTVNQRNHAEVITTVQIIPTIFRDAQRTIAIREGGGIYECCAKAVRGFTDWRNFREKLLEHIDVHWEHALDESYLQRLWTLQECLLSHTIEFVIDTPEKPEKVVNTSDFYRDRTEIPGEQLEGIYSFIRAYVDGGTIERPRPPERDATEDINTGMFREIQLSSNRCATMPRDYIFATMPQFPWYHYPLEAEQMEFSDIFMDLYKQASRAGHAFTCRIIRSMTDPKASPENAWLPSLEQPGPGCLGDFLKLLGQRMPSKTPDGPDNVHLTTIVHIIDVPNASPDTVLALIESAMRFSEQTWRESHRGGELSKYGSFPRDGWELNFIDAMKSGWIPKDHQFSQPHLRVIEDGDKTILSFGTHQEYEEDPMEELMVGIFGNANAEEETEYVTLLQQSRMILDHMLCGLDISLNPSQAGDWKVFRDDMRGNWIKPLLRMILLQAAMVSCGIGLSATNWMRRRFVPVCVRYNKLPLLGLLAKHALNGSEPKPRRMYSVGQHLSGKSFGKDLVLVDPTTKLPVGVLPDFLPIIRTDEEYIERSQMLYNGLVASVGPQGVGFAHVSLDVVDAVIELEEQEPKLD